MKTTLLIILMLPIVAMGQTVVEVENIPPMYGRLPLTRQIKGYCLTGYKELPDIGYFATYERVIRTDTLVTEIFGIPADRWYYPGALNENGIYHTSEYTTVTGELFNCDSYNFKPFNW